MEPATSKVAGADKGGDNSTKKEEASIQTIYTNAVDVPTKLDRAANKRDPSNPPKNSIRSTTTMTTTPPTTRPSSKKKKPPLSNATMTPPQQPTTMTPPLPQLLQPPSSRGPTHTSAPSMVFPRPLPSINAHNRNITPHTESLMNLFARPPASTPTTPTTPIEYNSVASNDNDSTGQQQQRQRPQSTKEQVRTPRRTNSIEKIRRMRDEDIPALSSDAEMDNASNLPETMPLIPNLAGTQPANLERDITITTNNLHTNAKVFHRQDTHPTHNRDETQLAYNLKGKDREEEERQYITSVLASTNEKTGLLTTRQHAPGNARDPTATTTASTSKNRLDEFRSLLFHNCDSEHLKPTFIGAFLFSLYQLVFCFAEASAISRPSHAGTSSSSALLSPMALMACVGSLLSAPMLIAVLSDDYPALYPCLDMFMAPFLGQMAADVDEVLATMRSEGGGEDRDRDHDDDYDDTAAFLATFVALNAFGTLLSGLLCVLAGKVKLANLAGFLPYPVLCGFFSSVGISIWMSAFKVDTGVTIQRAMSSSGSWSCLFGNFARHAPSFAAGTALYVLGPRGPHFLLGIIALTIVFAYLTMFLTGTSLDEAQDMSFFWKKEEVMMSEEAREFSYGPPAAFGLWFPNVLKMICWPAFMNGVSGVIAMSVIYLLRCSLHAAALNKCTAQNKSNEGGAESHPLSSANGHQNIQAKATALEMEQGHELKPKQKPKDLMMWYANSLFSVAFAGGFAVLPAIALGGIFSKIGATSRAPQYGAIILLLGCYLSDFWICSYVPKCTFSSLLVLAAIDLINSWFIKSYQKLATEWVVVPFIVITSLTLGMLQSVGLGLGASTLIFVASFYRAGVVKFIANGLTIRSTIERNCEDNQWLHENADLIQLLVLQNYLFFGNASSCLKYIQSMFDDEGGSDPDLPPFPKYVILDLSIVTGIDTSAVDLLGEISALCKENKCNLIFAGIPRVIRPALITGGVKPSRKNQHLSFSPDLDSALGRAEDGLLKFVGHNEEKAADVGAKLKHKRRVSMVDHGLRHALREIDVQHNLSLAKHLQTLEKYTTPIEINVGERLVDAARDDNLHRGLYFVESGIIRCDHDSSMSLTRGGTRSGFFAAPHIDSSTDSIGQVRARSATVGRTANLLKKNPQGAALMAQDHVFRLARIGPGWVIGSISEFLGQDIPGTYTALTPCRVHHLSFETLEELEIDSPVLILHLYKLLSHLSARRQEMTIGQLATMRSIFSSTAPTKPISRSKMAKLCAYSAH